MRVQCAMHVQVNSNANDTCYTLAHDNITCMVSHPEQEIHNSVFTNSSNIHSDSNTLVPGDASKVWRVWCTLVTNCQTLTAALERRSSKAGRSTPGVGVHNEVLTHVPIHLFCLIRMATASMLSHTGIALELYQSCRSATLHTQQQCRLSQALLETYILICAG
jgi:hypothetical protein